MGGVGLAAIVGDQPTAAAAVAETRAELGGRRQAITLAALRYAEGVMAGTRVSSPTPSTWSARPPCNGSTAATGWTPATASSCSACSPRPVSATLDAARLLAAARRLLRYLAPGFTANRDAAAAAASEARQILGDDRFRQA
jgi:hypothetical protein